MIEIPKGLEQKVSETEPNGDILLNVVWVSVIAIPFPLTYRSRENGRRGQISSWRFHLIECFPIHSYVADPLLSIMYYMIHQYWSSGCTLHGLDLQVRERASLVTSARGAHGWTVNSKLAQRNTLHHVKMTIVFVKKELSHSDVLSTVSNWRNHVPWTWPNERFPWDKWYVVVWHSGLV